MLSEVFYTMLTTTAVGCVLATARMLYKSKCRRFTVCCITVERDVEDEVELDRLERAAKPITPSGRTDSIDRF